MTPEVRRVPPLEAGDRLDQRTFHERYDAMPPSTRAELIGGIVYLHSRVRPSHGRIHARVVGWLFEYERATPGVETYDSSTLILGDDAEPQPDAYLIISPEHGGQVHYNVDEYLVGAPELVAEVASSTESIDLHAKRKDYEQAGVQEYVVVALRQSRVFWFVLREGRFQELQPVADGLLRSQAFPGLWLDPAALLRRDADRMKEVLQQGLASPEHAAFVARLTAGRGKEQSG